MKKHRAERLRTTVDCLPPDTKRAMLDGLEQNRIITGANTDRKGGVCPMIAADRNAFQEGPMADIFAAVWDNYNGACILTRREASERDLRVLKTMLETSLDRTPEISTELGQAWLDYHLETAPAAAGGPVADFGQELTAALRDSTHETGSFEAVPASPSLSASVAPAVPAAPAARKIELVYDGGPLPRIQTSLPKRSAVAEDAVARTPVAAKSPGVSMRSTYEPYTVAAPKPRAPRARTRAEASAESRVAQHAAESMAAAERTRARAIIANQAATLKNRAWPRAAVESTVPVEAAAPRHELPATPLEAPAIRQAAIPQLRRAADQPTAPPAGAGRVRPGESTDRTGELQGRTGWSWLPPMRSYDDYEDALETAGELEPASPRAVPEVQPPEEQRRPVRM
jgi:hypothetical protein